MVRGFPETFWKRVRVQEDGCWVWMGANSGNERAKRAPYGICTVWNEDYTVREYVLCHVLSYTVLVGPIPEGLILDHLCRNTLCVHPLHLEPVTRGENVLRGMAPNILIMRSGRCSRGHLIEGANAGIWKGKAQPTCKTCHREHEMLRRMRLKALSDGSV